MRNQERRPQPRRMHRIWSKICNPLFSSQPGRAANLTLAILLRLHFQRAQLHSPLASIIWPRQRNPLFSSLRLHFQRAQLHSPPASIIWPRQRNKPMTLSLNLPPTTNLPRRQALNRPELSRRQWLSARGGWTVVHPFACVMRRCTDKSPLIIRQRSMRAENRMSAPSKVKSIACRIPKVTGHFMVQ